MAQQAFGSEKEKMERFKVAEKILSIYSPSGEEREISSFIFEELQNHGLSPRIDPAGNVICEAGSGHPILLLCPHIDTIPGKIPVRREGNLLYGRGACDAKGALLSMLFAFEDIAEKSARGKVIFAGVVEEERESRGLNQLINDNVRADSAIFGEPGGLTKVTIGYRGHVSVTFEIITEEAHASAPWITSNAAEQAFGLYETIQHLLCGTTEKSKSLDSISVSLTGIQAGSAHNVIPGKAKMTLDIRLPFGEVVANVTDKVKRACMETEESGDCKISTNFAEPTEPYKARLDSTIARAINRSILKLGFDKPSFNVKSGTGDMNTYALKYGIDAVTYGPGDAKLSHTQGEFLDFEEVLSCAQVIVATQEEYAFLSRKDEK